MPETATRLPRARTLTTPEWAQVLRTFYAKSFDTASEDSFVESVEAFCARLLATPMPALRATKILTNLELKRLATAQSSQFHLGTVGATCGRCRGCRAVC